MSLLSNSGYSLITGMLLTLCVYQGAGNGEALVGGGAEPLLGSFLCACSTDWQKLKNSWKLFLLHLLRTRYIFNSLSAAIAHIQNRSKDVGWTAIFPANIFLSQYGEVWFSVPMFNFMCQVGIPFRAATWGGLFWGQVPGVYFSGDSHLRLNICSCSPFLGFEHVS